MTQAKTLDKPRNEDVEHGLLALALAAGNSEKANEYLQAAGVHVTSRTLRRWRIAHHDRYVELCNQRAPEIEQAAIHSLREAYATSFEGVAEGVQLTRESMHLLDPKDLSTATRNLAVVGGIVAEKYHLATDRPTHRVEHTNPEDTLRALATRFGIDVTSTAEDITDARELEA
jgi:hypothetical protein